jgi:hypothetical protein
VPAYAGQSLYDPTIIRTVFLEFPDKDWEQELADFAGTDVQIPARVTIDGRTYEGVGVRFAPRSRLDPAEPGYKRTLLLSFNFTEPAQRIAGQRQMQLLDDHRDPTGLRAALYLDVARSLVFAPWANFTQVAINGENWGIYTSVQPFDERFTEQAFGTAAGARWVVPSAGSLAYLGDDPAPYRNLYRLQTDDDPAAWAALIRLCRTLEQTPPDQLEAALEPQLDITGTVKLLALENALINQAGYRARGGGYGLYLTPYGRFVLVPLATESCLRLVETADFSTRGRSGPNRTDQFAGPGRDMPESVRRQLADREAAPRQASTDLAMLLGHSFINKADRDDDRQVTRDEWLGFARSWFIVLDENYTGQLSHAQFIEGFRRFVTPLSVLDGRTRQTFGRADPAAQIGGELFADLDTNHDGLLTRTEFLDGFARWHTAWSDPKTRLLAEEGVRQGLNHLLHETVFSADQTYIAGTRNPRAAGSDMHGGPGDGRGGRPDSGRGNGEGGIRANANLSVGLPGLNLGLGPRGGRGSDANGRSVTVLREQLDVFAGLDDARRPLLAKLLTVPALRALYLRQIRRLAEEWLTWEQLGARAQAYHQLITPFVKEETHRPASHARFVQGFDQTGAEEQSDNEPSLKSFLAARRAYLLADPFVLAGGRSH